MRRPRNTQRMAAAATAAAALFLAPSVWATHHEEEAAAPPSDERKPWDQDRLTELTGELATAISQLRRTYRKEPSFRDPNNPNRRASQQLEQTLRQLEQSTRQLSNRVKSGGGFEETRGGARRIGMLLNDADVEGRRVMTSVWMEERIRPAMKLINEIAPYFGSGPLYDPETMQRLDRPPNPGRSRNPCGSKN